MNEELQERLMSYLETLEGAVSSTSDFVIDQAPMYVQEIIHWQIVEGIIWSIFFSVIALGLLVINLTKLRSMRRNIHDDGEGWILGVMVIVLMICSIAFANLFAFQSLKAYIAPRVVIVEQLQKVIR